MWPERYDIAGDHGYFRPVGTMSLEHAVERINEAIARAIQRGVDKLLIETRGLRGFDSPSVAERFWFMRKWADTSHGMLRLALVARPEMIDPGKFGVIVARNRGMISDVFTSEAEAAEWLGA